MSQVAALLSARGLLVAFRQEGRRLFGPCPVHGGDNPRAFVIDLDGDRWYCFSRCRRGGGPAGLAAALGLPAPARERRPVRAPPPFTPYRTTLRLDPRCAWLEAKGIGSWVAATREVGAWRGTGMLAGCVALRLHDLAGAPLGYAGRRLDAEDVARRGKWVFPRGLPKSELLYGLHHVRGRRVVVTECPWGVLRLAQVGVDAVALLGVALSLTQRRVLTSFDEVVLLLDGDGAGRAAASAIARALGGGVGEGRTQAWVVDRTWRSRVAPRPAPFASRPTSRVGAGAPQRHTTGWRWCADRGLPWEPEVELVAKMARTATDVSRRAARDVRGYIQLRGVTVAFLSVE